MSEKQENIEDDENVDCPHTSNGKCSGCTLKMDEDCPYDDFDDDDYDEDDLDD